MLSGRLVDGTLEVYVAEAAGAALGHDHLLPWCRDVRHQKPRLHVRHQCAARHIHNEILAAAAEAAPTRTGHAVLGEETRIEIKRNE